MNQPKTMQVKKEKPILFNDEMVRALLDGRKTQTRRIYKNRKHPDIGCDMVASELAREEKHVIERSCPFGCIGDQLWVRETHSLLESSITGNAAPIWYWADGEIPEGDYTRPRPSIHMPRWASRILLEITDIRVERLQDISEKDAKAEGVLQLDGDDFERPMERSKDGWKICPKCCGTGLHSALVNGGVVFDVDCRECDTHKKLFKHLWNSTGGDWDANPWVWAIEFKRVKP